MHHQNIPEKLLQFIWQHRLFNANELRTEDNELVQIMHQGTHNKYDGPDFLNGKIKIGDKIWAGHIELHVNEQDWKSHAHHMDKRYDNVILHVVFNSSNIRSTQIPTIVLNHRISKMLLDRYRQQMDNIQPIPCLYALDNVPPIIYTHWRERLMIQRLSAKSQQVLELLQEHGNDWDTVAYMYMAKYFGLPNNANIMQQLAANVPYTQLLKLDYQPHTIEAIFFGVSGLLQDIPVCDYGLQLNKEFDYQKYKFNWNNIQQQQWNWLGMRPNSFPTVRIAIFAALCSKYLPFFEKIIAQPHQFITDLYSVNASVYWDTHFTFQKPSIHRKKKLNNDFVQSIVINVIAPIMAAYSTYTSNESYFDAAVELLYATKKENNTIVNHYKSSILKPANAAHTQGLLELYHQYCSKKRCLECALGCHILKKESIFEKESNEQISIHEPIIRYA